MIKVCIFIDWYIPGYKAGGPVKSLALLIEKLSKTEQYEFYVICRNTDYMDKQPYATVVSDQWNKLSPFVNVYYIANYNCSLSNYYKILQPIQPNILYINGIWSYKFSILPLFLRIKSIDKRIISPRGMLNSSAIDIKSVKKKSFLLFARIFNIYKNYTFHFTNLEEKSESEKALPNIQNFSIISNFSAEYTFQTERVEKKVNEINLFFLGRISPEKNLQYALECLVQINEVIVNFDIFGEVYNHKYWLDCKELIKKLPINIRVNYFGFIKPNELKFKLGNYHYLFLPTAGENFGHAISESLQAGIPVIISDKTPWNAIGYGLGGFVVNLNNQKSFIEIIEKAAAENDTTYMARVGEVQKFVYQYINSTNLLEPYLALFSK